MNNKQQENYSNNHVGARWTFSLTHKRTLEEDKPGQVRKLLHCDSELQVLMALFQHSSTQLLVLFKLTSHSKMAVGSLEIHCLGMNMGKNSVLFPS